MYHEIHENVVFVNGNIMNFEFKVSVTFVLKVVKILRITYVFNARTETILLRII